MRTQFLTPARLTQLADRFWSKVNRRGPDDCWEWQGTKIKRYGHLKVEGKGVRAHRISWTIENGPIPDGYSVLHRCDNPACVNPAHLFLGTQRDNMKDMARKGRAAAGGRHSFQLHPELLPRGERHWNAKVPDCIVRDVVRRYKAGGVSYKELADELTEIGIPATKPTLRRWVIGLGRSTALVLLLAVVLASCSSGPGAKAPEPKPELPPAADGLAPVPHPGEPFDEIPAPGRWVPYPEPVIDWSRFILPPLDPNEPHEPGESGTGAPAPDGGDEGGVSPEQIEEQCGSQTIHHVYVTDPVTGKRYIHSTELRDRGPNEKACCIAMLKAQAQPRAEGKMCGCACDHATDTCVQMKLQPPHHSNKDRDPLVCALAGPFSASVVDSVFK